MMEKKNIKINDQSDRQLIRLCRRNDSKAFSILYYRYRDWVYKLAWSFCRDHHIAQDVTQEVFAYLLKKFDTLKLTASMKTFLYPVVKHTTLNQLKKAGLIEGDQQGSWIIYHLTPLGERCMAMGYPPFG